jgi:hypothetical protein
VLSVLLRFGIFKLFISNTKKKIIRTLKVKKINDVRVWVYLRVLLGLNSPKTYPSSTYWLREHFSLGMGSRSLSHCFVFHKNWN